MVLKKLTKKKEEEEEEEGENYEGLGGWKNYFPQKVKGQIVTLALFNIR